MGVASLAWGTTGVATRAALNAGVPPVGLVTIRSILAAVIIYGLLAARRRRIRIDRGRLILGGMMAVTNLALPFILFTLALQYASAGFVGLLVALVPLLTATFAHFLLPDEPLSVAKLAGLAVGFAGVALLLGSGNSGLAEGGRPLAAAVLSVLAAASISYAAVYAKGRPAGYDPLQLTGMQFAGGAVLLIATMAVMEGLPSGITIWGWELIWYLAVVGSVVPFLAFFWALRHTTSTKASMIGYLVPLIALTSGMVFMDERLQSGIVAGGIMILAGVVLTDRAERRLVRT